MTEWETAPFGELYGEPSRNGLTKPKRVRGSGVKLINMGEIFAHDQLRNIPCDRAPLSESEHAVALLQPHDLLFARQSLVLAGAGKCSIFLGDTEPVTFESHLIRVRLDPTRADARFYYYLFRSRLGRGLIETIVEQGAGASGIRGSDLQLLAVPKPDLDNQAAIAETLQSFDDKIDANRRMNETLEAVAQAIFRDWFVDFGPVRRKLEGATDPVKIMGGIVQDKDKAARIATLFPETFDDEAKPVGWKSEPIGNLAKVQSGKRPPSKMSTPDKLHNIPVYGGNGISWFTDKVLFDPPFLITGRVGTLGTVFRVDQRVWVSDNALCCFPKTSGALDFLYFHLQELDYAALNSGSTQPLLTQSTLTAQQVVVGHHSIISAFSEYVGPLFKMVRANKSENDTLTQTRDLLLPKLMSGEIRLKDAEKIAEAAE